MRLIVGLGNPGSRYAPTRHNLGFLVVSTLAERYAIPLKKKSLKALWGQGQVEGEWVVLAQPTTYMNLSGLAVSRLLHYLKLSPIDLIVIHDDLDVPYGRLKLARGGSAGGHRGVLSVLEHLHTEDFYRVKLGIGRPPPFMNPEDFVLTNFPREDWEAVAHLVERAAQAVVTLLTAGLGAAQNQFHGTAALPS